MLLLPFALLTRAEKFCKGIHSWPIREQRSVPLSEYSCRNGFEEHSFRREECVRSWWAAMLEHRVSGVEASVTRVAGEAP